jgi:hypothetical protein
MLSRYHLTAVCKCYPGIHSTADGKCYAGIHLTAVTVYDLKTKQGKALRYCKGSPDKQEIKQLLTPREECIYHKWEDYDKLLG